MLIERETNSIPIRSAGAVDLLRRGGVIVEMLNVLKAFQQRNAVYAPQPFLFFPPLLHGHGRCES